MKYIILCIFNNIAFVSSSFTLLKIAKLYDSQRAFITSNRKFLIRPKCLQMLSLAGWTTGIKEVDKSRRFKPPVVQPKGIIVTFLKQLLKLPTNPTLIADFSEHLQNCRAILKSQYNKIIFLSKCKIDIEGLNTPLN